MYRFRLRSTAVAALVTAGLAGSAQAASVNPDIIFGSGNANGSFTLTNTSLSFPSNPTSGNIELGLRAKLRHDSNGQLQNIFNWDGTSTYTFNIDNSDTPANRAAWNFEWSVNIEDLTANGNQVTITDLVGSGARLEISYDTDPGAGTDFVSYNVFDFDAWYGTNATANGDGTYDATGTPVAGATVAQNSVNYGFIPGAPLGAGTYDIKLTAFSSGGVELASTSITVNAETAAPIPLPAALPLMLAGLGGLAFVARCRKAA